MARVRAGAAVAVESSQKYLTFYAGDHLLGISSGVVVEIIRIQPITFMPKLPPFVKGIINLRGKIVPLIDLWMKFGHEERPYTERTSIIVLDTGEYHVGLIVDAVDDVADIEDRRISTAPARGGQTGGVVSGIAKAGEKVVLLLDIDRVLQDGTATVVLDADAFAPDDGE